MGVDPVDAFSVSGYLFVMSVYSTKPHNNPFALVRPSTFRISSQIGCYPVFLRNLTCGRFPGLQPHTSSLVCTSRRSPESGTILAQAPVQKPPNAQGGTPGPGSLPHDAGQPSVHERSSNELPFQCTTSLAIQYNFHQSPPARTDSLPRHFRHGEPAHNGPLSNAGPHEHSRKRSEPTMSNRLLILTNQSAADGAAWEAGYSKLNTETNVRCFSPKASLSSRRVPPLDSYFTIPFQDLSIRRLSVPSSQQWSVTAQSPSRKRALISNIKGFSKCHGCRPCAGYRHHCRFAG